MKLIQLPGLMAFVLFAAAGAVYGDLIVHVSGENGVMFFGTEYPSPTAKPGVTGFEELVNGTTFDLFVSAPDDILIVDFSIDVSAGAIYQDLAFCTGYGPCPNRNTTPPVEGAVQVRPHLGADSWVTTPGGTACAQIAASCPGFGETVTSHFDSSNDGAQMDFPFARITMLPDEKGIFAAEFSGVVHVANQPLPLVEPFRFTINGVVPEPGAMSLSWMALLGSLAIVRKLS